MAGSGTEMMAMVGRWMGTLTAEEVTAESMAAEVGRVTGGTATQLVVEPFDDSWASAEVVSRADETAPSYVRLEPARPEQLTVSVLDSALGAPSTLPPKVHFDDPDRRIYEVDTGQPSHTAALIAELAHDSSSDVAAVILRRDIRL
jgi:hypothetical protein